VACVFCVFCVVCVACVVVIAIAFVCVGSRADTDRAEPGDLHLCADGHNWRALRHTPGCDDRRRVPAPSRDPG